ncbi:MAG: hypothetical protein PHF25_06290, partial [Candidatus Margulisbacteria bacterium]|nr:hypothetical protein [Candidatus Margulisiibacteriota bacterium]
DKTSAADADVFKIMTLALTNRSIEAKTCSDDFFKYETKDIQGLTIPLCGVNDTYAKLFDSPFYTIKGDQTIFLWNPSYSYSYASNLLHDLNPKWANLQRSQHLINSEVVNNFGLVDWCVVLINNNTGEINVSLDLDAHFPRTKVDSFHINQIFSNTHYANNWRTLGIFTEDSNGYLTYTANATANIDDLLNNLSPTPENEQTIKALTSIRQNSTQEFPGRGSNINLTEQKEWPRFVMDHLMNYVKYNDTYSLEMLNLLVQKHGVNLNNLLYYGYPNEIVIALRTGLKAVFNNISASEATEFYDQVLDVRSHVDIGNTSKQAAMNAFMSQYPNKYEYAFPEDPPENVPGTLYISGAMTNQEAINLKNIFINEEEKINGLQERSLITGYGEKWYDGKDWTFNQLIIGFIVNCVLQKIKLPQSL